MNKLRQGIKGALLAGLVGSGMWKLVIVPVHPWLHGVIWTESFGEPFNVVQHVFFEAFVVLCALVLAGFAVGFFVGFAVPALVDLGKWLEGQGE